MDNIALLLSCSLAGKWLLKKMCSWGSHQGSPQAALASHRYELVFETLQRTQKWCTFTASGQQLCPVQLRSRCFCCQLHFQISIANAMMLIPRTYKYLHHDWHVVVFCLTTSSFPLTSGQTNSDCHRLEYCTSKEYIYFYGLCAQGDFRLVLCHLLWRSSGKLSRRRPPMRCHLGLSWVQPLAASPESPVLVPWPLPCLTWSQHLTQTLKLNLVS